MHFIVVGTGPAGVTACETIRKLNQDAQITLVGAEPEPPYSRMAIPYLLTDKIEEAGTYLRKSPDYFKQQNINIIHEKVIAVHPADSSLELENSLELESRPDLEKSKTLKFDRLLLATGASPVNPPIPGVELPAVQHCWTLADARAIAVKARQGASVVLMGAGFIGCIILESLVKRGVNLTIVEMGDRMVPRMMDETAGQLLKGWCEHKGIRILTEHRVTAIEQDGDNLSVQLNTQERLTAQLVISATGVRSNTKFLQGSGMEIDQGVLVNEYLQTNYDHIYAAGDVAQGRDFSTNSYTVQAIQPTAVEHGRIAAINMVNDNSVVHRGSLNMNVLDTLGLISTSFGQWMGVEGGEEVVRLDKSRFKYLNLQFKDDYLVGASSLGHTENMGVVRGLIRGKVKLGQWKTRLQVDPTRLMEAYLASSMGIA
jgi:NAD(P)H-nitrite reductase large subunit